MAKEMNILIVEPGKLPREATIDGSLKSMQDVVGGYIQALYPFDREDTALVCNDEGKLLNLPPNRPLKDDTGKVYDIVCGTFFVVGVRGDSFCSLTKEQIDLYRKTFSRELILTKPKKHGRGR